MALLTTLARAPRAHAWRPALIVAFTAALSSGCVNANAYATARALEPGRVVVVLAPEVTHYEETYRAPAPFRTRERAQIGYMALPPTVGLRVGVGRNVDIGGYARAASSLGGDVKYNFFRGETVDLALRPGAQIMPIESGWGYVELPLMASLRVSDAVTVTLSPGLGYARAPKEREVNWGGFRAAYLPDGGMVRGGAGVSFRLGTKVALVPEVTAAYRPGDYGLRWVTGGVGLQIAGK